MHNQKIYWNSFEVAKVTFRRSLARALILFNSYFTDSHI